MELFGTFKNFVKIPFKSEILRLFYVCMILLFIGACLSSFGPYINGVKPISCTFEDKSINIDQGNNYCYLHGITKFPEKLLKMLNTSLCIADQSNPDNISNYTNMPQILLSCGALFLLPLWIFINLENGLLRECKKSAEKFTALEHNFKSFFMKYVICIFVLCGMMAAVISILNENMNNGFVSYGWQNLNHQFSEANVTSPKCALFPNIITCQTGSFSSAGGRSESSAICVLNFNIYYANFFVVLWCYFVFLVFAVTLNFIYWIALGCSSVLRGYMISRKANLSMETEKKLCELCCSMSFCRFFMLYYVVKSSSDSDFIEEFINSLCDDDNDDDDIL